ncbi:MAG: MBL fold metallo-hydrolase [Acidimicrobiia bacterium]|nr:MBL fold metallo-hydrolase [Acidimicrobiia bacterium]
MSTIQRLTDSCLLVTTDEGATMLDPGFHTYQSDLIDLDGIGEVNRILVTHEHGDHVNPDFVKWLLDRGTDVTVYANDAVAAALTEHNIAVDTGIPQGTSAEDVLHETTPMGDAPPNRAWTLDGILTHPGDSYGPTRTAPVLALGLLTPWGSATRSLEFARDLEPAYVVPVHDFYLNDMGRHWIYSVAKRMLGEAGIEVMTLDWGESFTL